MKFSKRIEEMQSSPVRRLVPFAQEAKAKGRRVYHLNIGQPDVKTPKVFFDAVRAFDEEVLEYALSQGIPELIDSIIAYYKKYDMHFEKDEILITNGGSEGLMFAMLAVADVDDEILVPEPFYTNYNGFASTVSVKINSVTTKAEEGFHLPSKETVVAALTPKTKAILLSNPGNPTGVVYTAEEVRMIADIAKEHNLYIISDEVYREFVYDGEVHTSFGSMADIQDRVILIESVSKRFSACGARIGSIASKNKALIAQIMKLCQGRLCAPTIDQLGAAELYKMDDAYYAEVCDEYRVRRDIVYKALKEMPGVIVEEPKGALYAIAKLPVEDAEDFIIWMLKEFELNGETVMMAPAEGFYSTPGLGKNEARIAYVLEANALTKAMNCLKEGLKAYQNR